MSATTSIEWTDRSWNPVRGCSRVSEGCRNCYAERVAVRFSRQGQPYAGLAKQTSAGPRWTGEIALVEKDLTAPLKWRQRSRIFVNSMSDLFHENVPRAFIDRVFAAMALAPWHTFQILTKRPERMRAYLNAEGVASRIAEQAQVLYTSLSRGSLDNFKIYPVGPDAEFGNRWFIHPWPLPNVWLGVSVEDQATANVRLPELVNTPAAVHFVSYEPALGPVDMSPWFYLGVPEAQPGDVDFDAVQWVIAGGESGPNARPCDWRWIWQVVRQCRAAGVPCFVKQLGANIEIQQACGDCDACLAGEPCGLGYNVQGSLRDRKGCDITEWPSYLRVREFPTLDPQTSAAPLASTE